MAKTKEACVGCGAKDGTHPIIAVATKGDVKGDRVAEHGTWAAHPVCAACWRDPEHRQEQPLKAHFFHRGDEQLALRFAGSDSIGG